MRKTFWINIYTVFFHINSKDTENREAIFTSKRIKIARTLLSLNDIEHGILRKTKFRMDFGFISNTFYSDFIKTLAVKELDYKIHFALRSISLEKTTIDYYDSEIIKNQLA